ncbi:hypothetical protein [Luteolibacter sp. AS25]|uniref:hypothetical protein n=1 Tax=Luteolibacter sp. AS25 TaxID=3135776 RepID=UPI00398B3027
MKILHALLNLLAGIILTRFTVSKFAAWPESVAGFEDMAGTIGLDPTLFRITSGFIIGIAALTFFTNFVIILFTRVKHKKVIGLFIVNALYAIGAMCGALISEFFLRSNPAQMLVVIAVGIIILALINLASYRIEIGKTLGNLNSTDK